MTPPLPALTLHPEWCIPILSDHPTAKRVENRLWALPSELIGRPIALHSGARFGGEWAITAPRRGIVYGRGLASLLEMRDTAISAGWFRPNPHDLPRYHCPWRTLVTLDDAIAVAHPGHIVAVIRFGGCDQDQRTPWDVVDAWHWRISDVWPLVRPIPCRGAQKIWRLPSDVDDAVRSQLRAA